MWIPKQKWIHVMINHNLNLFIFMYPPARRGGEEVAGWTVDRTIRVRFPAYPHRVWALWWQGGKRRLRTSRCPCLGRLGTLKTPSCPWRWVPGSRSKFGNWTNVPSLYGWNIAECDVKPQQINQMYPPAMIRNHIVILAFPRFVGKIAFVCEGLFFFRKSDALRV